MSVDNVQGNQPLTIDQFQQLSPKVQKEYLKGDDETKLKIAEAINGPKKPDTDKGTVVEKGTEEVATPEEKLTRAQRREAAKAAKEAEIARQKEFANSLYKPEEMTAAERQMIADIIGKDGKPLYKNQEAQKELRKLIEEQTKKSYENSKEYKLQLAKAENDKERQAIEKLYSQMAEKGARIRVKDLVLSDKIEHTRVFDSQQEKSDARKALGDDADDLRLRVHNKKFISEENVNLHNAVREKGITSHQAAYEMAKDISGDNTFEPNEVRNLAAHSSNVVPHDASARKEIRKLGAKVKDDTLVNLGKALAAAAAGQVGTIAFPLAVNAFAEAFVKNAVTGEILAYDSDSASATYRNWKGAGVGVAVGTAVAGILFPNTQDEDVLHGVGVEQIFQDGTGGKRAYENMSFGDSKNESMKVKTLLRAIDELDLTDEEKTEFLADAAGDKSQRILSKKELVIAYVKALESLPDEQDPLNRVKIEAPKPEINHTIETPGKLRDDIPRPVPEVLINNGDTFQIIADRFGVDVEDLMAVNKDIVDKVSSGHTDCKDTKLEYLLIGESIKLPRNANREAVEEYNKEFTADRIKSDYIKSVTSDAFLEKNKDCYDNIKAAGPEAEKAFANKIINEARAAGITLEKEPANAQEVLKLMADIETLKDQVAQKKQELKDKYSANFESNMNLQNQLTQLDAILQEKEAAARAEAEAEAAAELKARNEARAAEILEELKTPMLSNEYKDALKAEYEKLTGNKIEEPAEKNPFLRDWTSPNLNMLE